MERGMKNCRGFTLIELMIVAAPFLIIAGFIFGLFIATVRTAATQDTLINLHDEARHATERTMQLIRSAVITNILDAKGGGTNLSAGDAAQVTFQVPVDTDGDLQITNMDITTGTDISAPVTLGLDLDDADKATDPAGLTTTEIVFVGQNGAVEVLSRRAVVPNDDASMRNAPNGGFTLTFDGINYTVSVVLEQPAVAGNTAVVVRETRTFQAK